MSLISDYILLSSPSVIINLSNVCSSLVLVAEGRVLLHSVVGIRISSFVASFSGVSEL